MPDDEVAEGRAAGYSGTPLARKLGIAEGSWVVALGAPPGFADVLAPLPANVSVRRRLPPAGRRLVDVAVLFVTSRAISTGGSPGSRRRYDRQEGCGSPGPSGPRACRPISPTTSSADSGW